MPIQRLPRYQLFLEKLVQITPPEHSEASSWTVALNAVKDILLQINEHFEIFKKHYISFASSLANTTTAMPISNIITGELGILTRNELFILFIKHGSFF